jgi:hypothetical protein
VPNTKDADLSNTFQKILLYAVSGFGKTTMFGTMPGSKYLVNFDRANRLPLEVNHIDCEYEDIFPRPEIKGYEDLLKIILQLKERFKQGTGPKNICLDTGRDLHKVCMYYVLKTQGKEMPTQPDWGLAHERYFQRLNDFLDMPCNFLMNFHEMMDKDEITGRMLGTISIQGKDTPNETMKKFNLKLHGVMEPGKAPGEWIRKVHTSATAMFAADDKSGALAFSEDPDLGKIIAKIQAKLKGVTK